MSIVITLFFTSAILNIFYSQKIWDPKFYVVNLGISAGIFDSWFDIFLYFSDKRRLLYLLFKRRVLTFLS